MSEIVKISDSISNSAEVRAAANEYAFLWQLCDLRKHRGHWHALADRINSGLVSGEGLRPFEFAFARDSGIVGIPCEFSVSPETGQVLVHIGEGYVWGVDTEHFESWARRVVREHRCEAEGCQHCSVDRRAPRSLGCGAPSQTLLYARPEDDSDAYARWGRTREDGALEVYSIDRGAGCTTWHTRLARFEQPFRIESITIDGYRYEGGEDLPGLDGDWPSVVELLASLTNVYEEESDAGRRREIRSICASVGKAGQACTSESERCALAGEIGRAVIQLGRSMHDASRADAMLAPLLWSTALTSNTGE